VDCDWQRWLLGGVSFCDLVLSLFIIIVIFLSAVCQPRWELEHTQLEQ